MTATPTTKELRECIRLLCLCFLWYGVGSINGVVGKWILSDFPYPMTLTMVQLASIAIYSGPTMSLLRVRGGSCTSPFSHFGRKYYFSLIVPLAFGKFATSVLAHVSVWKVPVSYAHTVKATMPFFTVLISRLFIGIRYSWKVYASLLPIVVGVGLATITEVSFDISGMGSALMATAGFSVINIYSKKVLKDTGIHPLRLLCTLGQMAGLMFLPLWLIFDAREVFSNILTPYTTETNHVVGSNLLFMLIIDGVFHWLQNILAFTILQRVAPLTYAVANVAKRIVIITVSLVMLKNHVTTSNVCGMFIAIVGVFYYNKVKFEDNHSKTALPSSSKNIAAQKRLTKNPLLCHQDVQGRRYESVVKFSSSADILKNNSYDHLFTGTGKNGTLLGR